MLLMGNFESNYLLNKNNCPVLFSPLFLQGTIPIGRRDMGEPEPGEPVPGEPGEPVPGEPGAGSWVSPPPPHTHRLSPHRCYQCRVGNG